jgi:glycine/D-amino acid oxidase-like deaminating enzyme
VATTNTVNGGVSFWQSQLGPSPLRPSLDGAVSADVCIVGAGFTGLWTAYYVKQAVPSLSVVVVERRFAGFGASGRNGGWLSATVAGSLERYSTLRGVEAARELQRAMIDAVDEVIRVAKVEGIDADVMKGGIVRVARTPAQMQRLAAAAAAADTWGDPHSVLTAEETRARVNVAGVLGSTFNANGARLNPAKLVRGLADVVTRSGVTLYESTPATAIHAHQVVTPRGSVEAKFVVRATEGFSASLPGLRRRWLPMNSSMIVTEPLERAAWDEIGWGAGETLGDSAHAFMYAQRTADDRIAIGGRGVPYRFGSRVDVDGETSPTTVAQLQRIVADLFPAADGAAIDHAWSGVLGVPRDWCATVEFDPVTGLAAAGGYAGHGVTAANLAARTLRDLILGRDSALTGLPWVNWHSREWEREPLRWLGVRGLYLAYRAADRAEASGRAMTSRWARTADRFSGR